MAAYLQNTLGSTMKEEEEDASDHHGPNDTGTVTITKLVLPHNANHMQTTFGGELMEWMDEAACIVGMRHARMPVSVASLDDLFFMGTARSILLPRLVSIASSSFLVNIIHMTCLHYFSPQALPLSVTE